MPAMRRKAPPRGHELDSPGFRRGAAHRANSAGPAVERTQSAAVDLGRTARRLRESQNLTLADVAGRGDISSALFCRLLDGPGSPPVGNNIALLPDLRGTPLAVVEPGRVHGVRGPTILA